MQVPVAKDVLEINTLQAYASTETVEHTYFIILQLAIAAVDR